ncbi:MAG: hypothetical protein ACT4PM_01450 [Gemmatimonadales bacterium]
MKSLLVLTLLQPAQGGLESDIAALIARVPPPARRGAPSVVNVVSSDRVFAGDQLNVLTAAWLPRSLRLRLRQAPTLTPPALTGVWSIPRRPISGAVAVYEGETESYDLFVGAQTVYPLNPGLLTIPPARLSWVQPRAGGEERSQAVESPSLLVQVRELPAAGQPSQLPGPPPIARDLRIEYRLGAGAGRAGAVLPVEVALSGAGGIPLWPAPELSWPSGVRAYDQGAETEFQPRGSRLFGTRRFRFSLVPDSAGGLSLPPIEYPHFDPVTAGYRTARTPGIVVPILEAAPVTDQRFPLPLLVPRSPTLAERLLRMPGYVLWILALLPVGLIGVVAAWKRRRRQPKPAALPSPAEELELLFQSLPAPRAGARRSALIAALRDAGLERAAAGRLVHLHLAVEASRYGPPDVTAGASPREPEIAAALDQVPGRIRGAKVGALLVLGWLGALARPGAAQTGLDLYQRQQYAAAAGALRAEAERDPNPARWYNLAAAEYLSRRDAHAAAALLRARAQAPRNPRMAALWNELARAYPALRAAEPSSPLPLSADEWFALAILGAWVGFAWYLWPGPRLKLWVLALVLALGLALLGAIRQAEEPGERAVLMGGASLRVSPHGLAPAVSSIPAFSVVEPLRAQGEWWLVRSSGGEGWIPSDILALSSGGSK